MGKSGKLTVTLVTIESLDQAEDHLVFAATTDQGEPLEDEAARRMMGLPARVVSESPDPIEDQTLADMLRTRQEAVQKSISLRNAAFFEAEAEKLDGWADDLKVGLEREIKELDRQIKEARRAATAVLTLEEKLAGQKQVKALESQRNAKRRALFDAQDDIDRRREQLITEIEGKLQQRVTQTPVFSIRWSLA